MPAATSPQRRGGSAGPDDLDNLLDYDGAVEDFWKDMPEAGNNANETTNAPEKDMDEEVKVTKKRKPNPKLDEDLLLSSAGIPKLRRIAKDKLKFKGKGHEFSDITRMLNLYQLWLDELYPKAKFKDGLTMVEKLGHKKRMQVSRRAWIDESKGFRRREDEDAEMRIGDVEGQPQEDNDDIFPVTTGTNEQNREHASGGADAPEADERDALLEEQSRTAVPFRAANDGPIGSQRLSQNSANEPDGDELDALLNGDSRPNPQHYQQATKQKGPFEDDEDDEDELDALLAEEPKTTQSIGTVDRNTGDTRDSTSQGKETDFADDEEAMADMGW